MRALRSAIYRFFSPTKVYLVLFLVLQISVPSHSHGQMTLQNQAGVPGVVLLQSGSPRFSSELNDLLPPSALAIAEGFLNRSVIVVNETGKYIWGFSIVYMYPKTLSPSGAPLRYVISPSPGGAAERKQMLGPGDKMLITPVPDFLASRRAADRAQVLPVVSEELQQVLQLYNKQHPSSDPVNISLDSVIFENGDLFGPDTLNRADTINKHIKAEKDLAGSLSQGHEQDLHKRLKTFAEGDTTDEYSAHIASLAKAFTAIYEDAGEGEVAQILQSMQTTSWFTNPDGVRRIQ